MFKNLILYRISQPWPTDLSTIEQALAAVPFIECGATQEKSSGWVPPRGEAHGAMVESIGGQWIARFKTEAKTVPSEVLARKVAEKAARIEQETGRKPGRKETRELKDEARLDLLPMAFAKQASTWVWIDPAARLLVIDSTNQTRAHEIVAALVEVLPGLSVSPLHTQSSPQACMAHWLSTQESPAGFSLGRECELVATDESKAVVKYGRHPLDIQEVQQHIAQGKLPTKLALNWDDRVSFVLSEGLQLRKQQFLDVVFESKASEEDGFDTDVAIATGELKRMIPDLIAALGGEAEYGPSPSSLQIDPAGNVTVAAPAAHGENQLYQQAVDVVLKDRKASISYVQRKLRIGYNRAAQLLEDMEKAGVVSPMDASGVRKVLAVREGSAA